MLKTRARFSFSFGGTSIEAYPGDSIGVAMFRAGIRIFTRSFKHHRARGLMCVSGNCPNCLMNVDGMPNVRVCTTPAKAGMNVTPQNVFPSLKFDWLSILQKLDWLMPVGWYYKIFTHRFIWSIVSPFIRKAAGLGKAPPIINNFSSTTAPYDHSYIHTDVAIVGGGSAGLTAAIENAKQGSRCVLIDDQIALGGYRRFGTVDTNKNENLIQQAMSEKQITILSHSYCFGLYEDRLLGVVQLPNDNTQGESVTHIRADRVIIATGTFEAPLLFENNDLVGVMLSSGVERLIGLYAINPGHQAVVIGDGARAEHIASLLQHAGIEVVSLVHSEQVVSALGSEQVTGIQTVTTRINCDLIVVCGHLVPNAGLLHQAGASLEWVDDKGAFIPTHLPSGIDAIGDVTGEHITPAAGPSSLNNDSKRCYVCFCEDVTTSDLRTAIDEGFDQIETLKRYTTVSMGPCQGKMCQLSSIEICAHKSKRSMNETGVTTSRPPNPSVSLGALAGPNHLSVKKSPLHNEHKELNAVWMNMGDWKRPFYYSRTRATTMQACIEREYRAVRERVGVIDISPLGKIEVKGRDAGKLLNLVYTHRFGNLKVGRVRYAVMCDETGIILDDGTISRLSDEHYFLTTTTGNTEFVVQWLEWWLIDTNWDVHVINVTGGRSSINLAGPKARDVLSQLTNVDLASDTFKYMMCRQAEVAGAPATLLRIGFVGEMGWEIHVPADYGVHVWKSVLEAGSSHDILPFGVETQRVLRLEKQHVIVGVDTDAMSNPYDAAMPWVIKLDKEDFIGKASLTTQQSTSVHERLIGFTMINDTHLPEDGAVLVCSGAPVGRVTSARFSFLNKTVIGLAWINADLAKEGNSIAIRINGNPAPARIQQAAFYDPSGDRLRM